MERRSARAAKASGQSEVFWAEDVREGLDGGDESALRERVLTRRMPVGVGELSRTEGTGGAMLQTPLTLEGGRRGGPKDVVYPAEKCRTEARYTNVVYESTRWILSNGDRECLGCKGGVNRTELQHSQPWAQLLPRSF